MTKRAIMPAVEVYESPLGEENEQPVWEIEARVANEDWLVFRENRGNVRPIKLVVYPELREYVVREFSDQKIRLCSAPLPKIPFFALESDLVQCKWTLYFDPESVESLWFLFRMLLLFFGSRAQSRGERFFHASCVAYQGQGVLCSGPKGSGKSSLMYLACSRMGARFIADDQVLLRVVNDGNSHLAALGWPRRANLGLSLMGKEALDASTRETLLFEAGVDSRLPDDGQTVAQAWSSPRKSALHQRDFLEMFHFQSEQSVQPSLLAFPRIDNELEYWRIEPIGEEEARGLIEENLDVSEVSRYVTDYLGLLGQKPKAHDESYIQALLALPRVRVSLGRTVREHFPDFWHELLAFRDGAVKA